MRGTVGRRPANEDMSNDASWLRVPNIFAHICDRFNFDTSTEGHSSYLIGRRKLVDFDISCGPNGRSDPLPESSEARSR